MLSGDPPILSVETRISLLLNVRKCKLKENPIFEL